MCAYTKEKRNPFIFTQKRNEHKLAGSRKNAFSTIKCNYCVRFVDAAEKETKLG